MTTIVYAKGVVAADSRVTDGNVIYGDSMKKIYRTKFGVIGAAGETASMSRFVEWFKKGQKGPIPKGNYDAFLISEGGKKVVYFERGSQILIPYNQEFHVLGSGAPYAMGALYAGATAREAVKIAMKLDPNSGGKIISLKVPA